MNAGYVRLSRDDDKKNYISIENQKLIIEQFAASKGLTVDRWYEDDGVSGYQFERPGFSKLLDDLEKDIDIIIAKDLSRIGRHNAKVLLLLDDIKEQGKRLLLVDDDYDTYEENDDIIGIKTWYNERYIKDTSKKIKRVLHARQKEGTLVIGVPYGYRRNPLHKDIIEIIDTEAAYVHRIFDLYLKGFGYRKIAIMLTEEGIPTPSAVMKQRYIKEGKSYCRSITARWSDSMVSGILKNDFYIGTLRLHKRERTTLHGVDHRVSKENQLVFEKNHESIVDKETFTKVQELMKKHVKVNYRGSCSKTYTRKGIPEEKAGNTDIFSNCLFCKDCGSRLIPKVNKKNGNKRYYICNTYNSKGKLFCEYTHRIEEEQLVEDIITYIRLCRKVLLDKICTYEVTDVTTEKENRTNLRKNIISSMESNKKLLKTVMSRRLEDLSNHTENKDILLESYMAIQEDILVRIRESQQQLAELSDMEYSISLHNHQLETALEAIDRVISKNNINHQDVKYLINRILVDKEGLPDIELKYGLDSLLKYHPAEELNRKEADVLQAILTLIQEDNRSYTSAKHLAERLTALGYKKSKKSVLPYIELLVDKGVLKITGNNLKPYEILVSKEELTDMIKKYTNSMSNWWYATDGI